MFYKMEFWKYIFCCFETGLSEKEEEVVHLYEIYKS